MMLNEKQNKLIEDNINLVHHFVKKIYQKFLNRYTYDEIYGFGLDGLVRAAQGFDKSRGIKFSTYASRCIYGEILDKIRDDKFYPFNKNRNERLKCMNTLVSVNALVNSEETNKVQHLDRFGDTKTTDKLINKLLVEEALSLLSNDYKEIINLRFFKELSQTEVARIIGVNQIKVSRLERKAINIIREKWNISA
ncbi:MAG: sigma-70 family RNA polymerase sigma factor [Clostridiaceae bacterium]